jgi:hypothetical protein
MESRLTFSQRFGYIPPETEISIREDAPAGLRGAIVQIANEVGLSPAPLRKIVCRVLRVPPDQSNWSEYPNIAYEVEQLLEECAWHRVYDIAEAIWHELAYKGQPSEAMHFEQELNLYFRENGIGWKMSQGTIEARGSDSFEQTVRSSIQTLQATGRPTAERELHEAISDLSRRPEPDLTGAIHHSMAALECVMRDVSGDQKGTLGELLKRFPTLIPKPLDTAVEKLWGYASESGRHMREGVAPPRDDAELVVGVSAAVVNYLAKKQK